MTRPTMEVLPPGANGITSVIARFGKDCACASTDAPDRPNITAAQSNILQRIFREPPGDYRFFPTASSSKYPMAATQLPNNAASRRCESDEAIQASSFRDGPKDQT